MSEWISVEDRLPDDDGIVLIAYPGVNTSVRAIGWYEGGVWEGSTAAFPTVTHWMPLPEPPGDEG